MTSDNMASGDPIDGTRRRRAARLRPPQKRLSEILSEIAADTSQERITLARLMAAMETRAYGALILLFAFPNMLPSPPGLAGVLGLPLLFLSARMMLGQTPWLPQFIATRSVPRASFAAVIDRATPWLERAERLLRQRLTLLTTGPAQRVLGLFCLFLTIILVIPIPFGNLAPSFAICLIALGVLERDGLWVIFGVTAGVAASIFVGGMGYALVKSAMFLFLNAF
jgi:hypothetical protein